MRKKIRCFLPKLTKDILKEDAQYFNMKLEKICNLIVNQFGYEPTLPLYRWSKNEEKVVLNFNLTESNSKYFIDMVTSSQESTEAEFLRKLFSTYSNLHPSVREKIIFQSKYKDLEFLAKEGLKVKLAIKEDILDLVILGITRDGYSGYNTIVTQSQTGNKIYKLKDVKILKIFT